MENHMLYVGQSKYLDVVDEGMSGEYLPSWKNWLRSCLAAGDRRKKGGYIAPSPILKELSYLGSFSLSLAITP